MWHWAFDPKKEVWDRLFQHSQPVAEPDVLHIDSTSIKCHRTVTGARGRNTEVIGRSKDSLTGKVHHAVEGLGFICRLLTSPGQHADRCHAKALTGGLHLMVVVGDKGYDIDKPCNHWRTQSIDVCVLPSAAATWTRRKKASAPSPASLQSS